MCDTKGGLVSRWNYIKHMVFNPEDMKRKMCVRQKI